MLALTLREAVWFLPAVLPICIFVAWSDMRAMKIPNPAVIALVLVFAVLGLFAMPVAEFGWRWLQLLVVLVAGVGLNAAGVMGAGDAKFAAAAALFVALGDLRLLILLFAACLLAGFVVHRAVKHSPLRRLVPEWKSWSTGQRFPMGFPLSATLGFYLALGLVG